MNRIRGAIAALTEAQGLIEAVDRDIIQPEQSIIGRPTPRDLLEDSLIALDQVIDDLAYLADEEMQRIGGDDE